MGIVDYLLPSDIPVMLSRIAGFAIIILGLALGWKAGLEIGDSWWQFINTAVIPVAFGVVILVTAEVLSRLGNSDES